MSRLHQSAGLSILARYTSVAAVVPQKAPELGRKALNGNGFADEPNGVRLMERSRLPFRLLEDWPELLLTLVLFVGSLSGLVGGVIASSRF